MNEIKFAKVRDVKSPCRGTSKAAGIDFFVPNSFKEHVLFSRQDLVIPSGIRMHIPEGFMLMGADKSGVATSRRACQQIGKKPKADASDTSLVVGAKIVDEDYQGEIHIHVINVGMGPAIIKPGMKIAQFILVPVSYAEPVEVSNDELFNEVSERGDGAFGSTGGY